MNLQDIIQGLDYLSETANKSSIMINNMIVLIIELLFVFTTRFIMLMKINGITIIHTSEDKKRQKTIIQNHLGYEMSLALIIAWIIMMIVSSAQLNYVVNLIISPIVGTLGGITLDNMYILPRQNRSLYNTSKEEKKEKEKSNSDKPVIVNINNPDKTHANEDSSLEVEHLQEDIIDSSDFDKIVIHAINNIKDVQAVQNKELKTVSKKCDETLSIINDLREAEKNDKRILLKTQMYDCLSKGFVTPKEFDKIRIEYLSYINLLKGNSDVQDLYENYFSKLGVHEDRRKRQVDVKEDRRKNNAIVYGQFDNDKKNNPG